MIFALTSESKDFVIPELIDIDVFCFFSVANAVSVNEKLWWDAIKASLKLKRSVLILEREISTWPLYDQSKRFATGDNWSWLSPRGLSVISQVYPHGPSSFQEVKVFLTNTK